VRHSRLCRAIAFNRPNLQSVPPLIVNAICGAIGVVSVSLASGALSRSKIQGASARPDAEGLLSVLRLTSPPFSTGDRVGLTQPIKAVCQVANKLLTSSN